MPRFLVDVNAGRMVRWLRLLGYDAEPFRGQADREMMDQAAREGRIVVTRDHGLPKRPGVEVAVLESDRWQEQLGALVRRFGLSAEGVYSRCLVCNVPVEAEGCPQCERVYWAGSHVDRAMAILARIKDGEAR